MITEELTAVLTFAGGIIAALGVPALARRWARLDLVRQENAQIRVREIDHTEALIEVLQGEMQRLQERVDNLEQEREAWRAERVAFEEERAQLTGRVAHLEQRLAQAGIRDT